MADELRLVVLADSTAYYTNIGPALPSDPVLYPNVVARILSDELFRPVRPIVIAQPGSDTRRAWHDLTKEQHLQFDVFMGADAVIVGLGSFDHAPMGIPPVVEAIVPFIRPAWLRRRLRDELRRLYPLAVRATQGRFTRIPPREFARLFDGVLMQVRSLTQGASGAVLGPTDHRSRYYGGAHPQRLARERLQFDIARKHGFATVSSWDLVEPHADKLNSDGIHWPPEGHDAIGRALAAALLPQLRGESPRPAAPKIS